MPMARGSDETSRSRRKTGPAKGTGQRRRKRKTPTPTPSRLEIWKTRARHWAKLAAKAAAAIGAFFLATVLIFAFVNPPLTPYMTAEWIRQRHLDHNWIAIEDMSPFAPRSVVAAEDANFCLHWGFDITAIRTALDGGAARGASTISQQTVKNVWLWQGRSWFRKALEAVMTPVVELVWTKRRILEVYLNVAEFGTGVFGIEAAAQQTFGISAAELSAQQAARLAAVLPDPKNRSAANATNFIRSRGAAIRSGADTIEADGRAACFEVED